VAVKDGAGIPPAHREEHEDPGRENDREAGGSPSPPEARLFRECRELRQLEAASGEDMFVRAVGRHGGLTREARDGLGAAATPDRACRRRARAGSERYRTMTRSVTTGRGATTTTPAGGGA
jgi:hypothetical protein